LGSSPTGFYASYTRPLGITVLALLYWIVSAGGLIFGVALLAVVASASGLRPLSAALLSVLGTAAVVLGVLQALVGFNLVGMKRLGWVMAMAFSLVQIAASTVVMATGYFLASRPIQDGGIGELLGEALVAYPFFGLIIWESLAGITISVISIAYLTRKHVRSALGSFRLQPSPDMTSRRQGHAPQPLQPRPPSPGYGFDPFLGYPVPSYPSFQPHFAPPAEVQRPSEKFCRHCGVRIAKPASYCVSCGSRLA